MKIDAKKEILSFQVIPTEANSATPEMTFFIPSIFSGFDGHFPGQPVVPGISQLLMAQVAIEKFYNKTMVIQSITRAKFIAQLSPEVSIKVVWKTKVSDEKTVYVCKLLVDSDIVSSFNLAMS